jgi:hypothetical protein
MVVPPSTPSVPLPWPPAGARPPRRWPTIAWLVAITLVSGVAIVGWLRPVQHHEANPAPAVPTYTDQQIADAKTSVCAAFQQVHHAVELAHSHAGSTDYNAQLSAAALANVALDAGSRFLLTKLAEEPATPLDLSTAVRNEANAEQKALIGYLNGLSATDPQMRPAVSASDEATAVIWQFCK